MERYRRSRSCGFWGARPHPGPCLAVNPGCQAGAFPSALLQTARNHPDPSLSVICIRLARPEEMLRDTNHS